MILPGVANDWAPPRRARAITLCGGAPQKETTNPLAKPTISALAAWPSRGTVGVSELVKQESRSVISTAHQHPPPRAWAMLALAGAVLVGGAGLGVWLLGWPPVNAGAWRIANPFIACATIAGWSCWFLAVRALPGIARRGVAPRPQSYRGIITHRLVRAGHWTMAVWVSATAMLLLPAAFIDLVLAAVPAWGDRFPLFAFDARNLYVLSHVLISAQIMLPIVAGAALWVGLDLIARLRRADESTEGRFEVAGLGNPVVRRYQLELQRLGRPLLNEDVRQLGTRIELRGRRQHAG